LVKHSFVVERKSLFCYIESMDKLILFFIDGIGLAPVSDHNRIFSLFSAETGGEGLLPAEGPRFRDRSLLVPLDARMGVEGIPQSATGQTCLFTGVNAPRLLGYHLTAFPNEALLPLFEKSSIMKILARRGVRVTSANRYTEAFFTEREGSARNRFPASTLTIKASGVPFRMDREYEEGRAVFADITNELIRKKGYEVDLITPEEGAQRTLAVLKEADFVFFEYFMTDHFGHKRDRDNLDRCVENLNRYVTALAGGMDLSREALLIVSDHGNSEDFSTGGHTMNPVPGLLLGGAEKKRQLFSRCRNLTDIYDFMNDYF
jgi:2,3-bisphosphoglycerate-independent phosphoglycerate mutase